MIKSNHHAIRAMLRQVEDGMTCVQIARALGKTPESIAESLKCMPDAYIDRWVSVRMGRSRFSAVWCVVQVPENCPRPDLLTEAACRNPTNRTSGHGAVTH